MKHLQIKVIKNENARDPASQVFNLDRLKNRPLDCVRKIMNTQGYLLCMHVGDNVSDRNFSKGSSISLEESRRIKPISIKERKLSIVLNRNL